MQNDARAGLTLTRACSPHAEQRSRSSSVNHASMSSFENASRTRPRYARSLRTPMGREDVFVGSPGPTAAGYAITRMSYIAITLPGHRFRPGDGGGSGHTEQGLHRQLRSLRQLERASLGRVARLSDRRAGEWGASGRGVLLPDVCSAGISELRRLTRT